jgi:hypothetical protein
MGGAASSAHGGQSRVSACRTNNHKESVEERLPAIRNFHRWLIYGLQRSAPQRCPKYGRMYHMDQVLPMSSFYLTEFRLPSSTFVPRSHFHQSY